MTRIEKIKNHIKNHSGAYIVAALVTGLAIGKTGRPVTNTVNLSIDEDFIDFAYHGRLAQAGFKAIEEPDPNTEAGRNLIALIENHNSKIAQ